MTRAGSPARALASLWLVPGALVALACASTGGGGGAAACNDAGTCDDPGLVCVQGSCVAPDGGLGGGGAVGGGGMGGSGAVGGGGMGGGGAVGGGGTGGGSTGGFGGGVVGGAGGTGGFGGGVGGFGGSVGGTGGGGGTCDTSVQGATCTDLLDTSKPCGACGVSKCCSSINACLADATCSGLFECVYTYCTSAPNVTTCIGQNCPGCGTAGAITLFNAIGTCTKSYCAAECGGSTP